MENAITMLEYKIMVLRKAYNLQIVGDKIRFLKEVSKLISKIDSKIDREIYIDKITKQYDISKEAIFGEVNKLLYKTNSSSNNKLIKKLLPTKEKDEFSNVEIEREKMILYFLIKNYSEIGEKIISKVKIEDFKIERYKKIYEEILNIRNNNSDNDIYIKILNSEDEKIQASLSEILFSEYKINSVEKFTEDIINNYEKNKLNSRKNEIIKLLSDEENNQEDIIKLEKELNNIIIELAKFK